LIYLKAFRQSSREYKKSRCASLTEAHVRVGQCAGTLARIVAEVAGHRHEITAACASVVRANSDGWLEERDRFPWRARN